jgi:putative glutathione S-transferase
MRQIKEHYYTSHPHLNPFAVIPTGPNAIADFTKPHDRDRF